MIRYEEECVGCGLPCRGSSCPYGGSTPHLYCDECNEEVTKLYKFDGKELCRDCAAELLLSSLPTIRLEDLE